MVKAMHRAGIGVLLDVVFNHTAEGGRGGPVINFKGIGNETFYMLDADDPEQYLDFTGCGNTVNANHPFVARFIIDCLEYWVRDMHVDGFVSIWPAPWRAMKPVRRCTIRRCCGALSFPMCLPAARSLPKPGTPLGFTM